MVRLFIPRIADGIGSRRISHLVTPHPNKTKLLAGLPIETLVARPTNPHSLVQTQGDAAFRLPRLPDIASDVEIHFSLLLPPNEGGEIPLVGFLREALERKPISCVSHVVEEDVCGIGCWGW